ncbi:MAG TPA: hypothetical protein VFQ22_05765 [Longimicrobiales bacterium]|nr:hypothetical protein [Longimicrobiales bacterium]
MNELYWGSERSVNQIADELDVSKGALYAMIRPRSTGLACPRCGAPVVHLNRTALERRIVSCTRCEWDGDADEAAAKPAGLAEPGPAPATAGAAPAAPAPSAATPLRIVAAGALLGGAAGLALFLWARRR